MPIKIKIYILATASLILQSLTWFALHRALFINSSTIAWVLASIAAAAAISVTTFFMLVNRSAVVANSLIILSAAMYLIIFPHAPIVWFGGLVFCLFAFWYEHRIWRETKSRVDFSVTQVMSGGITILLYGILLLLGFNIYYNVASDFRNNPDRYYDRLGQQAAKTVPYFTKIFPDDANLNQPLEQYFESQAKQDPVYQRANESQRKQLLEEARAAFENEFKITASNDNQTLAEVMAQVAVEKIKQVVAPYQNYIPLIFALLITGLLYTFAFLIRWLILFISWILFRILLSTGFFKLENIQVQVQKLGL